MTGVTTGADLDHLPEGAFQLAPEARDLPSYLRAFAYAAAPWFSVLVVVFVERWRVGPTLRFREFQAVLVYAFLAAMLWIGPVQLVLSRFLADALFEGKPGAGRGATQRLALALSVVGAASALAYGWWREVPWRLTLPGGLLLASVLAGWVGNLALYGIKRYRAVVLSAAAGMALALVLRALPVPGAATGGTWPLLALAAGQLLVAVMVHVSLAEGLPGPDPRQAGVLRWAARFPTLAIAGGLQAVGLTALPVLAWCVVGVEEVPGFVTRWEVDIPVFLAFLVILPGQAAFLQEVERDFQAAYRRFLVDVEVGSAAEVDASHERLVLAFEDSLVGPARVQLVVTVAALLGLEVLLGRLGLVGLDRDFLRVVLVAASAHGVVLQLSVLAQYLDRRRVLVAVLATTAVPHLLVTPAALAVATEPQALWGLPYLGAAAAAALGGWVVLGRDAGRLAYLVAFQGSMRDAEGQPLNYLPAPRQAADLEVGWEGGRADAPPGGGAPVTSGA